MSAEIIDLWLYRHRTKGQRNRNEVARGSMMQHLDEEQFIAVVGKLERERPGTLKPACVDDVILAKKIGNYNDMKTRMELPTS